MEVVPQVVILMEPCPQSQSICLCHRCLIGEVGDGDADVCRICHGEAEAEMPLMSPCDCKGTVRYVHQGCLLKWMETSKSQTCEICEFRYLTGLQLKPFREWTTKGLMGVHAPEKRFELPKFIIVVVLLAWFLWSAFRTWYPSDEPVSDWCLPWILLLQWMYLYIMWKESRVVETWRACNSVFCVLENRGNVRQVGEP